MFWNHEILLNNNLLKIKKIFKRINFYSVGPVVNCHMPKDRVTQTHQGYGFVEFLSEEDADYAIKILNMIKLFGKPGK